MTSEYSSIYSRFLLRVTDYEFSGLDEKLAQEMMNGWMKSALSQPYIRRLFTSLMADDDVEEIEYEFVNPTEESSDQDFAEEIIAQGMVINWLSPQYHSVLNTAQFFSNSEQKYYSQANHMAELKDMYHNAKADLRKMIRDRAIFNNSYILADTT